MELIFSDRIRKLTKEKNRLEENLDVKITIKGNEVSIEGESEDEYYAKKVIEALDFGFGFEHAILIKTEEFDFDILNIKDYTKRKDLERIRGRIIGKNGKTLKVLNGLTECYFELNNNKVGIIGSPESMKISQEALISLIQGSKQANVYNFLEKHRIQPVIDLGLKEVKKKKRKK